ncbi:hypothetical protein [Streptomyces sp. GbtcB6]|uniref:hypothetical protein n=1 Tax=Streptomyces sp. GbtcB6 TaxID=2824751 RepID=UPI0020C5DDC2|nr:hypothetical protein [Streptomyces sp. GbtcB6]
MTHRDPLVPALADLLVDLVWWLESCGDEEVDPDSAVKMMESVGWALVQLPSDQRQRLSQVLADLAEAEQDPARRKFLESFPFAIGMPEDNESLPSDLGGPRGPVRQATSGTRTD